MARQEKARSLSNIEQHRKFKGKAFKQQQFKRNITESEDGEKRPRLSNNTSPAFNNNPCQQQFHKQRAL